MTDCIHHWILPRPNGEVSLGKCQNCKEEKAFPNYIDYGVQSPWKKRNEEAWEVKKNIEEQENAKGRTDKSQA